ncbi:histidine N-acetyltransferase-like [Acropora palmata]|uniref:histidine N-acetyltransferase-like n=1 Tax=Acropora palmata TaxID=6131 RepID=UPI003DA0B962
MAQNLTIRLARSTDYDQILKLSKGIYDGHDYLPPRYHTWMAMKNLHVMLAFSGNKLASLIACSIIDEGKTVVIRAGRTSPEFRGQGIYKLLQRAILDFSLKRYPIIQKWRLLTVFSPEMLDNSYENVDEQDSLTCMVLSSTKRPQSFSFNLDSLEIQSCTKEYVCNVIFQKEIEKLFPGKVIQADRFPIEPFRSNIDYLMQENDSLYFAVEKCAQIGCRPRSFSLGVRSQYVKFVNWCVTIYSDDPQLYQAHLVHQFKRSCEKIESEFSFVCCHDKKFTKNGIEVLQEFLSLKSEEDIKLRKAYVYEQKRPCSPIKGQTELNNCQTNSISRTF